MEMYEPLTQKLAEWFDKPLAELPDDVRELVSTEFFPMPWDKLTAGENAIRPTLPNSGHAEWSMPDARWHVDWQAGNSWSLYESSFGRARSMASYPSGVTGNHQSSGVDFEQTDLPFRGNHVPGTPTTFLHHNRRNARIGSN